mgnify:CR=1 FL=1
MWANFKSYISGGDAVGGVPNTSESPTRPKRT